MSAKTTVASGSLADQLKPVAAKLRRSTADTRSERRSAIRPVSQVIVTLGQESGDDTFVKTRTACLRWMAKRAGRELPQTAWEGIAFELEDVGAQRVGAVSLDSPRFWSARLDDADKNVPQRTWVTEIGLGQQPDGLLIFGVRLISVTHGEDVPFDRSIPGFVRPIIESTNAVLDRRPIGSEPWLVSDEFAVEQLIKLLCDPARTADVIVFALPETSSNPNHTAASAVEVHRRTMGAAHVVVLTGPASFYLSDRVGKEFSVFRQAVRTYLPGFSRDQDEPFRHPLGLPGRIAAWSDGGHEGYARMLVAHSLARSISQPDREQRLPSFSTVRHHAAKQSLDNARRAGSSDKDILNLALDEIAQLKKSMDEEKKSSDELLATSDREREEAEQAAQQAKARADVLRSRVDALELRLEELGQKPQEAPIPEDLENFQPWCERYLSGVVEIHNRAYQGVKKSQYQDDRFLYEALLLLRDYYVPMRRNSGEEMKTDYNAALAKLGLEESGSISEERLGEQGETYIVNYAGKRRVLNRHLKNSGKSKDQRFSFRLYFFWDEDSEQAIVGWLPSHLDTRQT